MRNKFEQEDQFEAVIILDGHINFTLLVSNDNFYTLNLRENYYKHRTSNRFTL